MKISSKYRFLIFNKYSITALAFLIYILFFDGNNLITQIKLNKELRELQSEKEFYEKEIATNKAVKKLLMSDLKQLEKFAREEYRMKKDNEDVFVFEYKN